jgi:exodeoxyribonuclease VII large subunit
MESARLRLENAAGGYGLRRIPDRINEYVQQVDDFELNMSKAVGHYLERNSEKLYKINKSLLALSPVNVLERGYSVVKRNDKAVSDVSYINVNDDIEIIFARGKAGAVVTDITQGKSVE